MRSRPVQRAQGDDVLEAVGLRVLEHPLHAAGLELEDRDRLRPLEHSVVGEGVVQRYLGDVQRGLAGLRAARVDGLHRPVDDGERAQAQEVELHQAGRLDVVLVELGDEAPARLIAIKRREIRQHGRRDDHAAGVHAGVACQSFQRAGEIDEVVDLLLGVVQALELRLLLQRVIEGDAELERNELGDLVDEAIGHAQHAADVAHDGLCGHGAVRDDLRDALAAVPPGNVVDHAVAALHAEVDVEVGHGDALGIQEALEEEIVAERIEVRDAQTVGDQGAGAGAAARAHRDAVLLGPADEVGDDEEVAGEAHLADDVELALQALPVDLGVDGAELGQPLLEARPGLLAQEFLGGHAAGNRIGRQAHLAELEGEAGAARYLDGVGQRFRDVGEEARHLLGGAQVLLLRIAANAIGVGQQSAVVDADARFVRLEVARLEEAHIVGGDYRDAAAAGKVDGGGDVALFIGAAEALQLDVEAVGKQREPAIESAGGVLLAAVDQCAPDIALGRAGERDQPIERLDGEPVALDQWARPAAGLRDRRG